MFKNYFKIAFRNFSRKKNYSLLNTIGLGIGMACCLLILLYIIDERSYDKWISGHEQVHRVAIDIKTQNETHILFAPTSATLAPALKEYPQIEEATRVLSFPTDDRLISDGGEKKFFEKEYYRVDPNFFRVFPYKALAGNLDNALAEPNTIVIDQTMAKKYFGVSTDYSSVIGKTLISVSNGKTYAIRGVIEDVPANSIMRPHFLASLKELDSNRALMDNWHSTMFTTFIKVTPGTDIAALENQISHIADKYVGNEIKRNNQEYRYFIQPLTSIHLHSDLRYELSKNNSITYITIFTVAAIFILLIACINFINLATARAIHRSREVGVRKVVGARRWQLIIQFLAESIVSSLIGLFFAMVLVLLALPWFNSVAEKNLDSSFLYSPVFLTSAILVTITCGLLAGFYPALILSYFKPVETLKSRTTSGGRAAGFLRNGLVVGQFSISIIIIVATIIVSRQLNYLKEQNLGFDKEQMLVLYAPGGRFLADKYAVVREEIKKHPSVLSVAVTNTVPGKGTGNNLVQLKNDPSKGTDMQLMSIDEEFLKTYNIKLLAGRNIDERNAEDTSGDEQNVLINEAALPFFGWKKPEEAIGNLFGGGWGRVVGVIKDFHVTSLQTKVAPMELYYARFNYAYVTVKVKTKDIGQTIASLENKWKDLTSTHPFTYFFLDEEFERQYKFENRLEKLFTVFSFIAILVACLGLFGLAAHTIGNRTKEISIRKVLGASVSGITTMLSIKFMLLVLISAVVAIPVSWWLMNTWLQDFAFKVNLSPWVFIVASLSALVIALLTVSFQAVKAAIANPVKSLRSE